MNAKFVPLKQGILRKPLILTCIGASLMSFQLVSMAQQAAPPASPPTTAQPAYPSSPTPRPRVSTPPSSQVDQSGKPRCTHLSGLEKSECERRDNPTDDAPAGITASMQDKQRADETDRKNEAAKVDNSSDPASDTLKSKPSSAIATRSGVDSSTTQKQTEQDSANADSAADDSDTLGKTRR